MKNFHLLPVPLLEGVSQSAGESSSPLSACELSILDVRGVNPRCNRSITKSTLMSSCSRSMGGMACLAGQARRGPFSLHTPYFIPVSLLLVRDSSKVVTQAEILSIDPWTHRVHFSRGEGAWQPFSSNLPLASSPVCWAAFACCVVLDVVGFSQPDLINCQLSVRIGWSNVTVTL